MNSITVAFTTSLLITFFAKNIMGVFFEKKRITLSVMLLTYAGAFCLLMFTTLFLSPQMHRFHVAIMFMYDAILIFASCLIVSLNYKSSIVRKFVAALSALPFFFLSNVYVSFIARLIYSSNSIVTVDFLWGIVIVVTIQSPNVGW